ncbi:MAG: hypothetical protein ACXW18_03400 [Pyrinomonadaceae bacterium]
MAEAVNPNPESSAVQESEILKEFYDCYQRALNIARSVEESRQLENLDEFMKARRSVVELKRAKEAIEAKEVGAKDIGYWLTSTVWGSPTVQMSEEFLQIEELIEQCLVDIQHTRDKMEADQAVIDDLKVETKAIIAELKAAA